MKVILEIWIAFFVSDIWAVTHISRIGDFYFFIKIKNFTVYNLKKMLIQLDTIYYFK